MTGQFVLSCNTHSEFTFPDQYYVNSVLSSSSKSEKEKNGLSFFCCNVISSRPGAGSKHKWTIHGISMSGTLHRRSTVNSKVVGYCLLLCVY